MVILDVQYLRSPRSLRTADNATIQQLIDFRPDNLRFFRQEHMLLLGNRGINSSVIGRDSSPSWQAGTRFGSVGNRLYR